MKWRWSGRYEFLVFLFAAVLLLLPLVIQLDGVPFHPRAQYTDLLTSHWPNAHFLKTELRRTGEFPLWNPLILSGAPLVADPLFSVWYPPHWLTIILPTTLSFNLLFILHLAWGGFGMFLLMRAEGMSRTAAIFTGLAFSGAPKLLGHIGLGHAGLVSAVAWTPWVLFCIRKAFEKTSEKHGEGLRWAALSGGVVAITFFADPRWLIPTAVFAAVYGAHQIFKNGWLKVSGKVPWFPALLLFGVTALGISSGLSLPLTEFMAKSTRANISMEVAADISLPLSSFIQFFIPELGGWPETLLFLGTIVLGLSLIGLISRANGWKFWFLVTIGSLLLAMGNETPIYPFLVKIIPGLKFIRVPARFLFLSNFGLAVLSGIGLEYVLARERNHLAVSRITALGYGAIVLVLGIAITFIGGKNNLAGLYMLVSSLFFLALFFISTSTRAILHSSGIFWIAVVIIELMVFSGSLLEVHPEEVAFGVNQSIVQQISDANDVQRIFSTSYSLPQHIAAKNSLQLADGINPLQLEPYVAYMARAVGYPNEDYSVTLPPFPSGDPSTPQPFNLDSERLGYLNVAFILSEYPIEGEDLEAIDTIDGIHLYENQQVRPRAWIETLDDETIAWREIDSIEWSPNEIVIRTDGPGLLVLSEIIYPGWNVSVDGHQTTLVEHRGLFRAVLLEPGEHLVAFTYRPGRVYIGAVISVLTTIALAWVWIKR